MFGWIRSLFRRKEVRFGETGIQISPEDVDAVPKIPAEEWLKWNIEQNKCPDCGHEGFLRGPSGGMSINIMCQNNDCMSRFNVAGYDTQILFAERIGEDSGSPSV